MSLLSWLALLSIAQAAPWQVSAPRIPMHDGVRLAADVLLPQVLPQNGLPVVLIQTRYWRSFQLKMKQAPGALPVQPREDITRGLLEAGFGVVLVDVRGTGASEGTWERPWSAQEVGDMGEILDWIVAQPWSNGRVGTYGLSYEGTTALLAASQGRPALRAVLAREIEWDLVDELVAPGGVRNVAFVGPWGESVAALDRGGWPSLFPSSARLVVRGPRRTDDDPMGTELRARLAARIIADVAADLASVRGPDDPFGSGGPPAREVGPSFWSEGLSRSGAAVGLWGGWWDSATADAVLAADRQIRLVDARIGPWNHVGDENVSPLGHRGDRQGRVELDEVLRFFLLWLSPETPPPGTEPYRAWFVAGPERWESDVRWPQTEEQWWPLGEGGFRGPERSLDVDFSATVGPDSRWTAGLLRTVESPDRARASGLLSWPSAPLDSTLSVFGAPEFRCEVELLAPEAALHVYLEAVDASGRVRLMSEGVARVRSGAVVVPLRAIAFNLDPGQGLRLSVAGADAGNFERIPAEGSQRITFRGEACGLSLPRRVGGAP